MDTALTAGTESLCGAGPASPGAPSAVTGLDTDVAIFANGRAGRGDPVTALLARAVEAVGSAGGRVVNDPTGCSLGDQLRAAADINPRLVIAIGGDGTVNAAARVAVRCAAALLVLPHGTMNLVARDLHLPLDPTTVLDAARELSVVHIDYATVNGELFLHSALIGVVPEMARVRELIRRAESPFRAATHLPRFVLTAFQTNPMELRLESGGRVSHRRSRSVAVTSNPLSTASMISYTRQTVAGGRMGVYASAHGGPFAPFKLLFSLGPGRLPRDPETLAASCETLDIHARRATMAVAMDGEVMRLETPLHFAIHPRALRVALPTSMIGAVAP